MLVQLEIDVATARPPRVNGTIHTQVEVDLPEHAPTIDGLHAAMCAAEHEAHMVAYDMALSHQHVVMVLHVRTTDIISV